MIQIHKAALDRNTSTQQGARITSMRPRFVPSVPCLSLVAAVTRVKDTHPDEGNRIADTAGSSTVDCPPVDCERSRESR